MAEACTIIYPVANFIIEKLASYTGDRVLGHIEGGIKAFKSTKEDLKIIAEDLTAICAVLQDAEATQYTNAAMKLWLKDLKKMVYDIDDILDEVATDALQRTVDKGHRLAQLRYYFSSSNPLISRFILSHKIDDFRQKLQRIVDRKNNFGLTERSVEAVRPTRDVFNDIEYVNSASVVGRDEAVKDVIQGLMSVGDATCPSVFPIVGVGGIGKTTLAKLVYEQVHSEFDIKIWACVSDEFNISKLLEDMLKSATGEDTSNHTLGDLVNKLRNCLGGKKYFLVLDDVWVDDTSTWSELKGILEVGNVGSVILITTRSEQVASITQTMKEYNLDRLSVESSWSIFSQLAFREGEEQRYPILRRIGRSIVEKCGGVPLVVKTMGSLLRRDKDEREWERINNMDSFTKLPGEYNKVMQILRISYDKLPFHLKPCFAYCSLKARDIELYPTQLIYLWSAHGLLQLEDGRDEIEDSGYACAKELVSRSLLEHPKLIFNETMFSCNIHDLLHELAAEILGKELAVVHRNEIKVSESTKHIIWGYEGPEGLKDVEFPREKFLLAEKARTFKFGYRMNNVSRPFLKELIASFSYLRTLEIGDSQFEELPKSIGNLTHLRGLKLSYNPLLKSIPDTICKLLNLETLDLYCCGKLEKLPKKIYRLIKLRYFVVTTCEKTLAGTNFTRLPSLRFLWIKSCRELASLWDDDDIGHLSSIRRLYIEDCSSLTTLPNSMKGLTALEDLMIAKCEELELQNGECLSGLQSLRSLAVAQVPRLECLPDGIQSAAKSLRYLYIANCGSITGLGNWSQCFALLGKITIHNCPNLMSLPVGFLHLESLQQLRISSCPHLSRRCAVPSGAEYYLIQHVPEFWLDGHSFTSQHSRS